jgi:hypothetical protein
MYGIQAVKFNNTFYHGTRGTQFDRAARVLSEGADGTVHETSHIMVRAEPMADLTSLALKTWISALNDSLDLPVKKFDGAAGMILYGAQAEPDLPGYKATAVHQSRQALFGLVHAAGIRWSEGGLAELALRAMFRSSAGFGNVNPLADLNNVALPTQQASTESFVLTALTVGGQVIKRARSVSLTIDPRFVFGFDTGYPYPVEIFGAGPNGRAAMRLEVESTDLDKGESTGAVVAVFTSLSQAGVMGAETVTLTLNTAWAVEESWGGDHQSPLTRRLVGRPRWNGVTRPLTWGVA